MSNSITQSQRDDMIAAAHQRLATTYEGRNLTTGQYHNDAICNLMSTYSDNTIVALYEYIMADLEDDREANQSRKNFLSELTLTDTSATSATTHEYLTLNPPSTHDEITVHSRFAMLRAVHNYQQLPAMDDYAEADEKTKEQVVALLKVTDRLYGEYAEQFKAMLRNQSTARSWNDPLPPIPNPIEFGLPLSVQPAIHLLGDDIIRLIIEQPQDAEEIAQTICRDHINDEELLRDIFTSNTPALRDGHL